MPRAGGCDDRRFTLLALGPPWVMIRARVSRITEVNLGFFTPRKRFDSRELLCKPLPDQSLVALLRAV